MLDRLKYLFSQSRDVPPTSSPDGVDLPPIPDGIVSKRLDKPGWRGLADSGMYPVLAGDAKRLLHAVDSNNPRQEYEALAIQNYHLVYGSTPLDPEPAAANLDRFKNDTGRAADAFRNGRTSEGMRTIRSWEKGWKERNPQNLLSPGNLITALVACGAVTERDHSFVWEKPEDIVAEGKKLAGIIDKLPTVLATPDPTRRLEFIESALIPPSYAR